MQLNEMIAAFSELPRPVLTVYLNTHSSEASRHPIAPKYVTWLKKKAKEIAKTLPDEEVDLFEEQLRRVQRFLHDRRPRERGLVISSGVQVWKLAALQVEVENELHWGEPATSQLLRLLHEHRPYFIVVVDHTGARFFRYQLRTLKEVGEKKFEIDISQWKKKELGHFAAEKVRKTRGSQRDFFEHRKEAQYARLCTETANQVAALFKKEECDGLFLAGPDQLVGPIHAALPREEQERAVVLKEDLGTLRPDQLQKRFEPVISLQELRDESSFVEELLNNERGTVLGFDETFAQLQEGRVGRLILARDLNPTLLRCVNCGRTDRGADRVCPTCRGQRSALEFRDLLPALVKTNQVHIEVVSGAAAAKLQQAGGMGGRLRIASKAAMR